MKIYIVTKGSYDDYAIVGAFSTEAKAEEYLNEQQLDSIRKEHPEASSVADCAMVLHYEKWNYYGIEEIEVDALSPLVWKCWSGNYAGEEPRREFVGTEKAMRYHHFNGYVTEPQVIA